MNPLSVNFGGKSQSISTVLCVHVQSSSLTGAVSVEPVTIATSSFNTTVLMVARETAGQTEVLQSSLISDQTDFVDR